MDLAEVEGLRDELAEFVDGVFASVPRRDQRGWAGCYLRGLMLDGRRKSIQPMAGRLPDGNWQALQQFVTDSPWDPGLVRAAVAARVCAEIDPVAFVVDDVSFPKSGSGSVGVAAQYCGALGKTANCQVAVTVHAATDTASCPISWRLYLPQAWAADPERCARVGIPPEQVRYQEKWRLALEILDEAAGWGLVAPVVLADAAYGATTEFRLALEARGLSYVLATLAGSVAQRADALVVHPSYSGLGPPTLPRYRTRPATLTAFATDGGPQAFTEVTWRVGSAGPMTSRFRVMSLRPAGKQAMAAAQAAGGGHYHWDGVLPLRTVLVEWPTGAPAPTDYWITNLPADTPLAQLVRLAKLRWRIEHDYRELKHGLGLDHYEGRTWRGWHHHVTLVTAAQAFLTLRRLRPKAMTMT